MAMRSSRLGSVFVLQLAASYPCASEWHRKFLQRQKLNELASACTPASSAWWLEGDRHSSPAVRPEKNGSLGIVWSGAREAPEENGVPQEGGGGCSRFCSAFCDCVFRISAESLD